MAPTSPHTAAQVYTENTLHGMFLMQSAVWQAPGLARITFCDAFHSTERAFVVSSLALWHPDTHRICGQQGEASQRRRTMGEALQHPQMPEYLRVMYQELAANSQAGCYLPWEVENTGFRYFQVILQALSL